MDAQSTFVVHKSGSVCHLVRVHLAPAAGAADLSARTGRRSGGWIRRLFGRLLVLLVAAGGFCSLGASARTPNFIVSAPTPQITQQIAQAAEKYRKELAIEWLGREMPTWAEPCPITVQVGEHLGAGGATSFMFERGEVYGWRMTIQGSLERVLDSVLPHEVTHTVFATHFRRPLPRWADEGACTTVEHPSEKAKQQMMLVDQLRTGRGIAFSQMFAMKEYPHDVMPLYSQGYSVARFLIAKENKQKFLEFIGDGMRDENWSRAVNVHYGFADLSVLQNTWLDWVRQGSPNIERTPDRLLAANDRSRPAPNLIYRGQDNGLEFTPTAAPPQPQAPPTGRDFGPTATGAAPAPPTPGAPVRGAAATRGDWHAPGMTPADAAAGDPLLAQNAPAGTGLAAGDASHQMTRPQPAQGVRQTILEWSRPHAATATQSPQSGTVQPAVIQPGAVQPTALQPVPAQPANAAQANPAVAAGSQPATASVYGGTVIR